MRSNETTGNQKGERVTDHPPWEITLRANLGKAK